MKRRVKRGSLAISQIILLIVSTIAFSYVVGQEFEIVSAQAITEKCVLDKNKVQVDIGLITNVNEWCNANGGRSNTYCKVDGSGTYSLQNIFSCPTATTSSQPPAPTDLKLSVKEIIGSVGLIKPMATQKLKSIPKEGGTTTPPVSGGGAPIENVFSIPNRQWQWDFLGNSLLKNAGWAIAIYGGIKLGLQAFGVEQVGGFTSENIARAAGVGYFAGSSVPKIYTFMTGHYLSAVWAFGIGAVVFVAFLAFTGGKERRTFISFSCLPWQAPTGGSDCEKCNNQEFPCTEYRCRSLGQQCELANKGTTEELCTYVNRLDPNPPLIKPWLQTLTTGYSYSPDDAIAPPSSGVKIVPTGSIDGCVAPFKPVRFGITSNQPATCKFDTRNTASYSEMKFFFSNSLVRYNHSFTIGIPSKEALAAEDIILPEGNQLEIYVRCQNTAKRTNVENFIFKICVEEGPDRTPPEIVTTSILNGDPISFGKETVDLQVYLNEPAECRWSRFDKTYDDMADDVQMTCATGALDHNNQFLYPCKTALDGLKDMVDNDFYFKCLDQPSLKGKENEHERNEGPSYKFTLKGTQPLVISSVAPNNTVIKDSTNVIKVTLNATTSAGFDQGAAVCSYKDTATTNSPIEFITTGTHRHSQDLYLPAASYVFEISCVDKGGNVDTKNVNFKVETDTKAPSVTRVFRQQNQLKVITNEEAQCVYSNFGCNYLFSDGTNMTKALNGTEHSTAWDTNKVFYIKCADRFGNQPLPNQCNMVAKPFEMVSSS